MFTDVSKVHIAFMQLLVLPGHGDEGITIILEVGKYLPVERT